MPSDPNNPNPETSASPEAGLVREPEPDKLTVTTEASAVPNIIEQTLDLLGYRVKDKITDFVGVVVSVTFDVNGCIQAIIKPKVDKDGKTRYPEVIDVQRLELLPDERVVTAPDWWNKVSREDYSHGPNEIPADYLARL